MAASLFKEKICVEDIELSLDSSIEQTRGTLTPFNAFFIPYNLTDLTVGLALNNRYSKAESQSYFAKRDGDDTIAFKVYPAVNVNEATSLQQVHTLLDEKSDKDNVLELNNSDLYVPLSDYNPATKRYVDQQFVDGASGSFTSADGKTITVLGGLIMEIV